MHVLYRYMRTPEAKERLSRLHSKTRVTVQQLKRLEKRLDLVIERRGIEVDDALHQDLCSTMVESSTQVKEQLPPGSFGRIFWDQQEKNGKLKNAKSMRWEPAMIRFSYNKCETYIYTIYCTHALQMVHLYQTPFKLSIRGITYVRGAEAAITEDPKRLHLLYTILYWVFCHCRPAAHGHGHDRLLS